MPPPHDDDEYAEDVEAIYRDKINRQTPKYAPVVMRADVSAFIYEDCTVLYLQAYHQCSLSLSLCLTHHAHPPLFLPPNLLRFPPTFVLSSSHRQPGVVYMDAQMSKLLEKQDELLAGQRRQGKEIADLRAALETLTNVVSETNKKVTRLKDEIVPPLHNAMHDNAEATLQSIAHYSGEKIVVKTIHDVLPKLSNTLAEIVAKSVEDSMVASQVLQDLDVALKQGGSGRNGGRVSRVSASGRVSLSVQRRSGGSGSGIGSGAGGVQPSGPELWERAKWLEWLRGNVSLFKSLTDQEVADVFDSSTECYRVDPGTAVVEQGEDGDSMFVLVQGELNVFITATEVNKGQPLLVTVLGSGQFFGEMSLLTGDVRAATVSASERIDAPNCYVLELSRGSLQPVLARRPNLSKALAEVVAERRVKNLDWFREAPEETKRERRASMVGRVIASVGRTIMGGSSGGGGKNEASARGGEGGVKKKLGRTNSTAGARWAEQQQQQQRQRESVDGGIGGGGGGGGARGFRASTGTVGAMGGGNTAPPVRKTSS